MGESPSFDYTTGLAIRRPDLDITSTTLGIADVAIPGKFGIPQIYLGRVGNVTLITNVNARRLHLGYTGRQQYDAVIFNNPYVGKGRSVGPRTADLIQRFVYSARQRLNPGGEVHVNVTEALLKKYPPVRSILNTANYRSTFGRSPYFAPYVPRYTDDDEPFNNYENLMDVVKLRNYVWR